MYETQSLERTLTRYEQRNDRLDFLLDVLSTIPASSSQSEIAVKCIEREFVGGLKDDAYRERIDGCEQAYKFIMEGLAQKQQTEKALELLRPYAIGSNLRVMISRYSGVEPIEVVEREWHMGCGDEPKKIAEAMKFAGFSDREIEEGLVYLSPSKYSDLKRYNPNQEELEHAYNIMRILLGNGAKFESSHSGGRGTHLEYSLQGINFYFDGPASSREAKARLASYLSEEGLEKHLKPRQGSVAWKSSFKPWDLEKMLDEVAPIELLAKSDVGGSILEGLDQLWKNYNAPRVPTWDDIRKIIGIKLRHKIDQLEAEIGKENN